MFVLKKTKEREKDRLHVYNFIMEMDLVKLPYSPIIVVFVFWFLIVYGYECVSGRARVPRS